ncbi:MAG: IS982 family transposase [Brachymonas sp.]
MDHLTELYCLMDDFCKEFEPALHRHMISTGARKRRRACSLSLAELMTLLVLFHQVRYRQFKQFYLCHALAHLRREFPRLPSYQRCVELMPRACAALAALFECLKGRCSGISIADSSPLAVCDNLRIRRHKVFEGIAQRGKSSTGWFYGFKLHAIINHLGELVGIKLTAGNVDDRKALKGMAATDSLFGKLFADKGYIAKWLTAYLAECGSQLITKVRKNMPKPDYSAFDQAILKQRSLIETVFDELKNLSQIEHTRHRSVSNFMVNLLSGIIAYCLQPKKPKLNVSRTELNSLIPN